MKYVVFLIVFLFSTVSYADNKFEEGKQLAQNRLYDEALEILRDIDPKSQKNPVELFFYRACCNFFLLNKEEALTDLNDLIYYSEEHDVPRRFVYTAHRMILDIGPLESDSLDEIGRLMADNARRISLQRTGSEVTNQQQLIIDKLDKLIEEREKQKQQQQQSASKSQKGSQNQSKNQDSPLEDSQIGEDTGDGDVTKKQFKSDKSWGNLPPEERKEAVQSIARDLPWHYREAIEAYMRKMAVEGGRN